MGLDSSQFPIASSLVMNVVQMKRCFIRLLIIFNITVRVLYGYTGAEDMLEGAETK